VNDIRDKLSSMLGDENALIAHGLAQTTRDHALVRAEIRAELLRELLHCLPLFADLQVREQKTA